MSDTEGKPRVISVSGSTNRPKVISASLEGRGARVWLPTVGDPTPNDALGFVTRYRDFANLEPTYGFMGHDLERMVQASRGAPLRFVYELRAKTPEGNVGHWMLYVGTLSPGQLRIYDPVAGLKDLAQKEGVHKFHDVMFNDPKSEAQWGPESTEQREKVTVIHKDLLNPRNETEYQLNEAPLAKLGPIQQNAYDCGPLCVYAGMVARKI